MAKKDNKVNPVDYIAKEGYPTVGYFKEQKELQKFYKKLPIETLEDWCAKEGLEYTPCENPSVHRMRVCMAILYKHFPKPPSKAKEKSKYADIPLETLMQMAIDNDVLVEPTDHDGIMRMRCICALRAYKLLD